MAKPALLDLIATRLATSPAAAADLAAALGVSQATMSRALRELEGGARVLRLGTAKRGARYALRRELPVIAGAWPLCRIDEHGEARELGVLHALAGDR